MSATLKTEREEREEAPRHDYLNSQGREECNYLRTPEDSVSDYWGTEGGEIIRPVFVDSSLEVSQTLCQINLPGERLWSSLKHFDPIII